MPPKCVFDTAKALQEITDLRDRHVHSAADWIKDDLDEWIEVWQERLSNAEKSD